MIATSGLYKYVYNDEIIYVGMSKTSIPTRISQHAKEARFKPYLKDAKVYFAPITEDKNRIKAYETLLIAQYCPVLNVSEKPKAAADVDFASILPGLRWFPYAETENAPKPKRAQTKAKKDTVRSSVERTVNNAAALLFYQWIDKNLKGGNCIPNPSCKSMSVPVDSYIKWLINFENVDMYDEAPKREHRPHFIMNCAEIQNKRGWAAHNLPIGAICRGRKLLYITVDKDLFYQQQSKWLSIVYDEKQNYDAKRRKTC